MSSESTGQSGPKPPSAYRYQAFVSYSRVDSVVVDDLFRRLSRFRTPRRLMREEGHYGQPPRSLAVFLDRKSVQLGATIPERLQEAIPNSAFLILVCSEAASKSSWVAREVEEFLKGSTPNRILPVLLQRSPNQPPAEIMPPPLARLGGQIPIGADMIVDGGPVPVSHKLLGAMLGFPQDWVAREQENDDRRRRLIERAVLSTIAALSAGAALAGWTAASEARKAKDSLGVALTTLDATTFMSNMLAQGRVTTKDVEGYAKTLNDTLQTKITDEQLRGLPDIQFAFGQVMTSFASFNAIRGDADGRALNARRALNLLRPFASDPDPQALAFYCAAAFQAAQAAAALGEQSEALASARSCDDAVGRQTLRHSYAPSQLVWLGQLRVGAKEVEAGLQASARQFGESLAALDAAESSDRLDLLRKHDESGSQVSAGIMEERLTVARAGILQSMGKYEDAVASYASAGDLLDKLPASADARLGVELGLAIAEGRIGSQHRAALKRLDPIADDLVSETARDPALRGKRALLATIETVRASIYSDMLEGDAAPGQSIGAASSALGAFRRGGAIMQDLLTFDPDSRAWRAQEADRLVSLGDFLFRQHESRRAEACGASCLKESKLALERAIALLSGLGDAEVTPLLALTDARIRLSRTLRTARLAGAEEQLAEVSAILGVLEQRAPDDRGVKILQANLADERADGFADRDRFAEAFAAWSTTLAIQDRLASEEPQWVAINRDALWTRLRITQTAVKAKNQTTIRSSFADACEVADRLANFRSGLIDRDIKSVRNEARAAGVPCASATPPRTR